MSDPVFAAIICEINDGAYFKVKLFAIPHVGELIELHSFVDERDKYPPKKFYEVVQVVHNINDVSENIPSSIYGKHFVSIFVKPATSEFFK